MEKSNHPDELAGGAESQILHEGEVTAFSLWACPRVVDGTHFVVGADLLHEMISEASRELRIPVSNDPFQQTMRAQLVADGQLDSFPCCRCATSFMQTALHSTLR